MTDDLGAEFDCTQRQSIHCSIHDDDADVSQILIVTHVPDAVFEEQQAQVTACVLVRVYFIL